jgi:hypothetical protein
MKKGLRTEQDNPPGVDELAGLQGFDARQFAPGHELETGATAGRYVVKRTCELAALDVTDGVAAPDHAERPVPVIA